MKNKLKKVGIIILSLGLLYVPAGFQGVDVQAARCSWGPVYGYNDSRDVTIHVKTKVITGYRGGVQLKSVTATFPNGKIIKTTIPEGQCGFSIPVPSDVELTVWSKIRMTYVTVYGEYSVIETVRPILEAPRVDPWKGGKILTGTGIPGHSVSLSISSQGVNSFERSTGIVDAQGKWSVKLNDTYVNPTIYAEHITEDELIEPVGIVYYGLPFVQNITQGDKKIFYKFEAPVKVTFPNGRVVTSSSRSIDVPKDIILKPMDKIKFEALQDPDYINDMSVFSKTPLVVTVKSKPSVVYQAKVQKLGWQSYVQEGKMAGTAGKSLSMEALRIKLSNSSVSGGVSYTTQVQRYGWQKPVSNDQLSGTTEGLRLEGVRIVLTGELAKQYDIYYRTQIQGYGWLGWAKNGGSAGSEGKALRMEGIEIKLVSKTDKGPESGKAFVLKDGTIR